jgi:hypothetical protein
MEACGHLHAPAALQSPPGKPPRYPYDRTLDGPQCLSGRGGEEKEIRAPVGDRLPVF